MVDLPTPDDPRRATVRPRPQVGLEPLAPEPGHGAGDLDGHADGDLGDALEDGLEVRPQVRLAEHDDGLRAARPGRAEVALQAAHVEVAGQGLDDEDGVDVGGHDLRVDAALGGGAHEGGAPRQDRLDGHRRVRAARWLDASDDPVADGGAVGRDGGGVAEVSGQPCRPGAGCGHHGRAAGRGGDHATGQGVTGEAAGMAAAR